MAINNEKKPHKIHKLWEDVSTLIGMEEELLTRISILEKSIDRLWKKVADLNKQA